LFPKQEKYTLGQKIENTILETLELVLMASYTTNNYKIEILRKANNKIDFLKYLIRLAHETNSIKIKSYVIIEEKILEIGKNIGGWRRSIK
jgi:hypothetical protein